jgi:hypothetical protein
MPKQEIKAEGLKVYAKGKDNQVHEFNYDRICWNHNCNRPLAPDENDFCGYCKEEFQITVESKIKLMREKYPNNPFIKVYDDVIEKLNKT